MERNQIVSLATTEATEIIRHTITADERNEMANDSVHLQLVIEKLDDELKDFVKVQKEKIKEVKTNNRQLIRNINNGFVDQEMQVYHVPDEDRQVIEFFEKETAAKVGERPMNKDERQSRIKFQNQD